MFSISFGRLSSQREGKGIFGEHYTGNERIIRRQNEHYIYGQDAVTKEKVTDSSFEIDNSTNEKNKKYHIECQSTPDGSMLYF